MDLWPMIEADRRALADYLAELSPDEWKKQSLCEDWSVEQVAAHILVIPTNSEGKVFVNFAAPGFNLGIVSDKMLARILDGSSTDDIVDTLRSDADWPHSEGPLVEGTARDLVLAMTSQESALDRLSSDGAQALANR